MAYTDFDFYINTFFGNTIPEEEFPRFSSCASDWIDTATFDRLQEGLPENERGRTKIQKAVCAAADILYQLDLAEKQSLNAAGGGTSAGSTGDGNSGLITSKSAGNESISYATPQQAGAAAKEWNAIYTVVGNPVEVNKLLNRTVTPYLTGVTDNNGVPLLYAGV